MAYKVMIVDDEDLILSSLETFLTMRGYEVHTSNNPVEALERIEFEKFHVVLMDINMPQMTGLELLKRVKTARPTVQVIMMTAYTTIQKCIECVERGASDYLLKPFEDMEQLANLLDETSRRVSRWEVIAKESLRHPRDVTAHQM
ncbi:MAG: response regulator [bacterium]|nr:response regulator [bacterium]